MRKSIVAALAAALALGGAAVAFADNSSTKVGDEEGGSVETVQAVAAEGGPPMVFGFHAGPGPEGSFAEDLAAELGLSTEEVEQAMEALAEKQRIEARQQMAETLSEHLDDASVEEIQAALAVAEEQMHQAIENGEPPEPDQFSATLAEELGLSEEQVEDALTAMREDAFSEFRERGLEERFGDEIPKALREGDFPPPGPPGVSFAFPTG